MEFKDFKQIDDYTFLSNERIWFENEKVGFWYRIWLNYWQYIDDYGKQQTNYQVKLIVDEESIHPNHKQTEAFSIDFEYGFWLKDVVKSGRFNVEQMEKVLKSALKLKVENIIKKKKYQKILGIVNGGVYKVSNSD